MSAEACASTRRARHAWSHDVDAPRIVGSKNRDLFFLGSLQNRLPDNAGTSPQKE